MLDFQFRLLHLKYGQASDFSFIYLLHLRLKII